MNFQLAMAVAAMKGNKKNYGTKQRNLGNQQTTKNPERHLYVWRIDDNQQSLSQIEN